MRFACEGGIYLDQLKLWFECIGGVLREGSGAPDWIRTSDQRLRKPLLYPTELQVHI